MKMFSMLTAFVLLGVGLPTQASQLVTQDARSLATANYVVLGRVTSVSYDQKKFSGSTEVAVIEIIKGKIQAKTLKIPVDKNPLDGFDVLLNKGDVAVFFFREVKDGKADLVAPGAHGTFSPEYFK